MLGITGLPPFNLRCWEGKIDWDINYTMQKI